MTITINLWWFAIAWLAWIAVGIILLLPLNYIAYRHREPGHWGLSFWRTLGRPRWAWLLQVLAWPIALAEALR